MFLYDLNKTCNDVALANLLAVAKRVLSLIQIIGPILLMIGLAIVFIKMMVNPDEKKNSKQLKNSVIALVMVFVVPILVNVVMTLLDDSFNLTRCWNYSEDIENPMSATYISVDSRNKTSILVDSGQYEQGEKDNQSNSGNNSTSSNSSTSSSATGKGMGGKATKISIKYNKKDSAGRCGKKKSDKCAEIATVEYPRGTVKYYMGYQNNSGLLGGSCRSHAFTCGMNATKHSSYNTLDLQNYLYSTGDEGVLKGRNTFNKVINNYGVNAKAYFNETSISKSVSLAKAALNNGQPVIIFVSHDKCSDLASSHHALLLLGYDSDGKVVFLDSCSKYPSAKKRTIEQLGKCMSGDKIAKNWMRMVIFDF